MRFGARFDRERALELGERLRQSIGATDALRTGTYAKTLTFSLTTTQP